MQGEYLNSTGDRRPDNLFRNRGFLLLWAAYGVSAMGDHISEMAVLKWLNALEAPNITQLQAMMSFTFFVPFFALGPFMGMLADRLPRRLIMISADLVRAVMMLGFGALLALFAGEAVSEGTAHLEVMSSWQKLSAFMPLMFVGVFAAMFSPARVALLPTLIHPRQLVRANAMSSGLGVIATMIAVLIGGWLADHYPARIAFLVDAGTFILSAVLIFLIIPPREEVRRHTSRIGVKALGEAVRYVTHHRRVAQLIGVAVVVWACGATVRATMPAMVRDVFERSEYFEISGFQARLGFGMLAGAIILTLLGSALRSEVAISWSLMGIGVSIGTLSTLALFDVPSLISSHVGIVLIQIVTFFADDPVGRFSSLTLLDASTWIKYHIGGIAIILAGVFAAGTMASYNALMQRILPNRLRGRVFGLTDLCTMTGLLLTTGLIGIPRWGNIDAWIGYILLGVTVIVVGTGLASILIRLSHGRLPARKLFWWNLNEFYCKFWFRLRREGICTVPGEGRAIVVANHTCSIDPLLLTACTPWRLIGFMVAREFYVIPIAKHLIRMLECIPVRRDGTDTAATKQALRHLKEDKVLGIFIEGRINSPDEEKNLKEGAAMLAARTGAVIVPVHISGTYYSPKVMPPFFRRHRAVVRYGKPIDVQTLFTSDRPSREELRQATNAIFARIKELGEGSE